VQGSRRNFKKEIIDHTHGGWKKSRYRVIYSTNYLKSYKGEKRKGNNKDEAPGTGKGKEYKSDRGKGISMPGKGGKKIMIWTLEKWGEEANFRGE